MNKNTLNKLFFDTNLSIDKDLPADYVLRKSMMNSTNSNFFNESDRCEQLAKMCVFYKRIQLMVKRLTKIMKDFSIENLSVYTRFSYDSSYFLAENREQSSHSINLRSDWSRDIIALENLGIRIAAELNDERVLSSITHSYLKKLCEFFKDLSKNVLEVDEVMKSEYGQFNEMFG